MKVKISINNLLLNIFCVIIGVYSSFYYFNFGFPQIYLLYLCLILLLLSKPNLRNVFSNSNLFALYAITIVVSFIGLIVGGFNVTGINYFISIVVLILIFSMCKDNTVLLKKLYKMLFAFSAVSVISIYYEFLAPDSFFSISKNLLSTGSYSTLVHVYTRSGAYCGLAGYSSLAAFSCVVLCACTFSGLFGSTKRLTIKRKAFNISGFLAGLFALILTTKRSLFMAMIISGILVFVYTKNLSRRAKHSLLILAGISIFVLFYFVRDTESVVSFLQRFQYSSGTDFSSGRSDILEKALSYLGSNWVLGYGTGMGTAYSNSLGIGGGLHNIYIQCLFENGFIGLIVWIALFIKNLRDVFVLRYDQTRPFVMLSMFIQLSFLIYGFFGNPLYDLCIFCIYIISTALPSYSLSDSCN